MRSERVPHRGQAAVGAVATSRATAAVGVRTRSSRRRPAAGKRSRGSTERFLRAKQTGTRRLPLHFTGRASPKVRENPFCTPITTQKLLAKLDMHEPLAQSAEANPAEFFRSQHAALYRRILGIEPAKRIVLRQALRPVAEHGGKSIAEVR